MSTKVNAARMTNETTSGADIWNNVGSRWSRLLGHLLSFVPVDSSAELNRKDWKEKTVAAISKMDRISKRLFFFHFHPELEFIISA